jgi:hypothetical protein
MVTPRYRPIARSIGAAAVCADPLSSLGPATRATPDTDKGRRRGHVSTRCEGHVRAAFTVSGYGR